MIYDNLLFTLTVILEYNVKYGLYWKHVIRWRLRNFRVALNFHKQQYLQSSHGTKNIETS